MTAQQFAIGVGAGGALVDVSSYVTGPEGSTFSYGRQSEFRDPSPAQLTFVLDNYDGRFTPGSSSTPYPTPLTEGASASWVIGGRVWAGVVSAIGFAATETDWGRVTVTVGDVFYVANRTQLSALSNDASKSGSYAYWSFADAVGSSAAAESSGNNEPAFGLTSDSTVVPTFGVAAVANVTSTQAEFVVPAATTVKYAAIPSGFLTGSGYALGNPVFPSGSLGAWGMWVTPKNLTSWFELQSDSLQGWKFGLQGSNFVFWSVVSSTYVVLPGSVIPGVSYYLSAQLTVSGSTRTITVYVNGVQVGTESTTTTYIVTTQYPTLVFGNASAGATDVVLSQLSFRGWRVKAESARTTDLADLVGLIAQTVPQMTVGTIDSAVSSAQVSASSVSNAWSALCDVVRTEQGHIYTTTTGTLTSPSTTVNVRARTRPTTVTLTLDAAADLDGVPQFLRDITNMFGVITASGANSASVTVTDPAAVARVGSASTSESTVLASTTDLLGYAQDRMLRGENVALKVEKIVVNTTTSTVTMAQLLALNLGDRIRVSNLPSGALGFTQWDGWFIGAEESHTTLGGDVFTLYVAPVLPPTGVYDTDLFAAGPGLVVNANITSTATTLSVFTTAVSFLETVQVPYTIQIDQEQMTVTACTPVSGTTQTATVARGVNGTTPAAHTLNTAIELANPPIFAF